MLEFMNIKESILLEISLSSRNMPEDGEELFSMTPFQLIIVCLVFQVHCSFYTPSDFNHSNASSSVAKFSVCICLFASLA
jgi:hypothetical protein